MKNLLSAIFLLSMIVPRAHASDDMPPLSNLIEHRLTWMGDVAGYKYQHQLPVEDLDQEAKVLDKTAVKARELGLDEQSIRPFIQAQMDVAKAVQRNFIAEWKDGLPKDWQPMPLSEVRQKIAAESDGILLRIASDLKAGKVLESEDEATLVQKFATHKLPDDLLHRLFESLRQIKLK